MSARSIRRLFSATAATLLLAGIESKAHQDHPLAPGSERPSSQSPDFFETTPEGKPFWQANPKNSAPILNVAGPIAPAANQPSGALSGRIIFTSAGHGWTYDATLNWLTQRGVSNRMIEDYGNLEQMTMFAYYCFNAGATVVGLRPIGYQTNEVVLDNVSPGVTFVGSWSDSTSAIYFGAAGATPYRFASLANSETATATYTPNIPRTGFYPVYTWVRHGSDRGDQLYRILQTGGESQVRIPHYMVGNGWVYLGTYYFNAGSNAALGSVIISNLRSSTNGGVVIADAIRFGNGMGDIDRGTGFSDYPREEECSRYWVQRTVGQGQDAALYDQSGLDDQSDNVGAPPRMAAEMNREGAGNIYKRVYIGFHSNAGGAGTARGAVGLYRSDTNTTPNQQTLAYLMGHGVNTDMSAIPSPPLEVPWNSNRASESIAGIYGEINGAVINQEMDATIIEVAFHDNTEDAKIMRDPKGRNWIARAVYHAAIKYMNQFDLLTQNFVPEPPTNVRAIAGTSDVSLSWTAPGTGAANGNAQAATGYVIYRSTNGYGFGSPVYVGNFTSYVLSIPADVDYYFRIAATNAGGESFPSETVACRRSSTNFSQKVLIVNAFDRFDRTLDLQQNSAKQNYVPPNNSGTMDRVIPRSINSFDYVVQHGKALAANGWAFDSCQNEAVANGQVLLANYPIVIWACGQESTADETFSSTEQTKVTTFLNAGGHLFVSGSEIGWDLDRASGPTAADRSFYNNYLRAKFYNDTNDDSGIYTATAVSNGIFSGRSNATFDDGTKGIYWVQFPDILTPNGTGVKPALYYNGTTNAAAIQYDGSAGGGRVVYFGFPFETITSTARQNNYMADILNFFTPAKIVLQPTSRTVNEGANTAFSVTASGHATLSYQWRFEGTNLSGATMSTLTLTNVQATDAGNYSVIVSNSSGSVTSSNALLTVNLRPTILQQPQSQIVRGGSNATFTVAATGSGSLFYQWRFESTDILDASSPTLVVTSAQSGNAGNYSVVVSNFVGSVTSSNALLTVDWSPQFQSADLLVGEGLKLSFTAEPGSTNAIETSSNLLEWLPFTNVTSSNSLFELIDPDTNQPQKFYRALRP